MRPASIAWFEALMFGSIALAVAQFYTLMDNSGFITIGGALDRDGRADLIRQWWPLLATIAMPVFMTAGLTLAVSRKRSKVAAGVSFVLYGYGLLGALIAGSFTFGNPTLSDIALAQIIVQGTAYAMLCKQDSRDWLASV
jgi:hypothetical protein